MEAWPLSAADLTAAYGRRELSPVDVVEEILDRIDERDPALHAFLFVDHEGARAAARSAERAWSTSSADGSGGRLCGVPVSVKDTIEVAGQPTSYGSLAFRGRRGGDSEIARRLRAAGACLLGKTNTSEFALATHTHNRLGPPTGNAWNPELSAGGSSGGAAAAVADGLGPVGIGTDSAGSIRLPAAYNGIVGVKPTFGLIPAVQQWRASPTRSHNGPLTRTVEDAVRVIEVLADRPGLADDVLATPYTLAGARVAVLEGDGDRQGLEQMCELLRGAGARLVAAAAPPHDPVPSELEPGVWAYAGDHLAAAEHLSPGFLDQHVDDLTAYAAPIYRAGQRALAYRYRTVLDTAARYAEALDDWISHYDFVVCSAALGAPPLPHDPADLGPRFDVLTMWNAAGAPAAVLPVATDVAGRPVSGQLVARRGRDRDLLAAALELERLGPGTTWPDRARTTVTTMKETHA